MQHGIPQELAQLKRWFLCHPNKTPTLSHGWQNPENLVTYNALSVESIQNGYLPAFVFLEQDGYLFVDFDKTASLQKGSEVYNFHISCLRNTRTYAEYSTSGTGFHLIYKHPRGWAKDRKNKTAALNLECYSHDRYGIITGNRANNNPIVQCEEEVQILEEAAASRENGVVPGAEFTTLQATEADSVIAQKMWQNDNDNMLHDFQELYTTGRIHTEAFDTSEFELAFCSRAAQYTADPEQIERLWLSHPVSRRDWMSPRNPNRHKTLQREDYRQRTIRKALASPKSLAYVTHMKASLPPPAFAPLPVTPEGAQMLNEETSRYEPAVGIMQRLTAYYEDAALHCMPQAQLYFALIVMARFVNGTYEIPAPWRFGSDKSPLGLYCILIAPTGSGKSFPLSLLHRLDAELAKIELDLPLATRMKKLELEEQQLPYPFSKVAKLWNLHARPPSEKGMLRAASAGKGRATYEIGEFSNFYRWLTEERRGGVQEGVKAAILSGYDGIGSHQKTYAKEEDDLDSLPETFMNIFGETTAQLYGDLEESDVTSGLLNRFLILDYDGDIPAPNFNTGSMVKLKALVESMEPLLLCATDVALTGSKIAVQIAESTVALFHEKYKEVVMAANSDETASDISTALHLRDFRKAQRLAVMAAVSRNPTQPIVEDTDFLWGLGISSHASEHLADKFKKHETGRALRFDRTAALMWILHNFLDKPTKDPKRRAKQSRKLITLSDIMVGARKLVAFRPEQYRDTAELVEKAVKNLEASGILNKKLVPLELPLPNEKTLRLSRYYSIDTELLDEMVEKPTTRKTMFLKEMPEES